MEEQKLVNISKAELLEPSAKYKGPVCGMSVLPDKAAGTVEHGGATYYFCGKHCAERFRSNPEQYVGRSERPRPSSPSDAGEYICPMHPEVRKQGSGSCPKCGMALEPTVASAAMHTEYACPMHPEVVRSEPGTCPICSMALEPRTVTADESNPEYDDMRRRFWASVVLTIPILAVMVSDMMPGQPLQRWLGGGLLWAQFALATPIVLWAGWHTFPVIPATLRAGRRYTRKIDEDQYGSFPLLAGLAKTQSLSMG